MIGLDTNILVRLVMRDDQGQFARALDFLNTKLSPEEPGFISTVVIAELFWTLRRVYRLSHERALDAIELLLSAYPIEIEHGDEVSEALSRSRDSKGDFSDMLIAAIHRKAGCVRTVSFDRAFIQSGQAEPC